MIYKVISAFNDLNDNNYAYRPGDAFPRDGVKASAKRLAELSGRDNKRGEPLIEKIKGKKNAD